MRAVEVSGPFEIRVHAKGHGSVIEVSIERVVQS